jgi:Zn-finger domain-containing protein
MPQPYKNNLTAGQFTAEHEVSKRNITELIQNDGHGLLRIEIDDLGQRLQFKLNIDGTTRSIQF